MASSRLVLASTSRYRAQLLERLEVPFEVAAPRFDEDALRPRFAELGDEAFALLLARGKAASLRDEYPDAWLLAADQIGVLADETGPRLLGKPGTQERAVAQLLSMSGRSHQLVTAVVLVSPEGASLECVDRQRLRMRAFAESEARAYVARHLPLDSAGAYRIEDAGIRLFERIEGNDYTGIIGLPLLAVASLLRDAGLLTP